MRPPRIAVVIPAHNEERFLSQVLRALSTLRERSDSHIVVVDVGSTDRTAEIAKAHGCQLVPSERVAPGTARNKGVESTEGEILAFLDGDVVVTPLWLERVQEILLDDRPLEGIITGAPYGVRCDAGWIERVWFNRRPANDPTYVNAGNMLLRRDLFVSLGGFDSALPTGEDYDLCQRARAKGVKLCVDHRLDTIHLGYPRSAREFVVREAWHGTGDAVSLARLFSSRVAIGTIAFLALFLALPAGLVIGSSGLILIGVFGPLAIGLLSSWVRWRSAGWRQVLTATPIFLLYFAGRSLGLFLPEQVLAMWRARSSRGAGADRDGA